MKSLIIPLIIFLASSCLSNNDNVFKSHVSDEKMIDKAVVTSDTLGKRKKGYELSIELFGDSIIKKGDKKDYEYILLRDSLISVINSDSLLNRIYKSNSKATANDINNRYLNMLEKSLFDIVRFNPLNGSFKNPESSLETLIKRELGFGKLDAIVTRRDSFDLYVTTNILFMNYYGMQPGTNYSLGVLSNIFQGVLSGAVVIGMHSYSMNIAEINSPVHVAIILETQDPYPTQPKVVYAFWTIDNFAYILRPWYPEYFPFRECEDILDSLFNSESIEKDIYELYFSECCLKDSIGQQQIRISERIIEKIFQDIETEKVNAMVNE